MRWIYSYVTQAVREKELIYPTRYGTKKINRTRENVSFAEFVVSNLPNSIVSTPIERSAREM